MSASLHPTVTLIPGGMLFDSHQWRGQVCNAEFRRVLGIEPRVQPIALHKEASRSVLIYDDLGMYALEDVDEGRIIYAGFAFHPSQTSFPPRTAFVGRLTINGTSVHGGMRERDLPLKGEMNFVRGIGKTWKFAHDSGFVEMNLKRPAGRSQMALLASVTHSFLKD